MRRDDAFRVHLRERESRHNGPGPLFREAGHLWGVDVPERRPGPSPGWVSQQREKDAQPRPRLGQNSSGDGPIKQGLF
eukprot:1355167-Amorphochlora_amoeboformis.AAC.1